MKYRWLAWGNHSKRAAMLGVIAVLVSGCGASSSSEDAANSQSVDQLSAPSSDKAANTAVPAPDIAAGTAPTGSAAEAPSEGRADTASQAADSFNGTNAADAISRKIIYKAHVTLQVENYEETQAQIQEVVSRSGGYVLQFNENESAAENSGSFVLKVPAAGFSSLLAQLEQIHPSAKKSMEGQDVSEEYVDLSARLTAKQVVEARLISFMEKASKTDELLAFSNELGKVQEEIERLKGRIRYLEQNVAYSTIEVRVTQRLGSAAVINAEDRGPLFQRAADALNGSAAVMMLVFQWIVVALAAILPIALVVAVIGVPLWLLRRNKQRKLVEIRQKLAAENSESDANLSKNAD
ncbi:DUF4349 domain-containing protein [Paenibacillus xerothermodurans]|nr:DUF4349 domain-containing protein [Paenibacillus xerothermodurans]